MKRSRSCETKGLKKGVWTEEEDQKLLAYVKKHGEGGWRLLPQKAGLMRCGKSCRLRWANYLRPGIRRGEFTPEEEQTIIRLHAVLGNRWATIARHLYRRTDNEIKNHWNTRLKKHVANATNIASTVDDSLADSNIPNNLADKSDHISVTTSPTQAHDSENNNIIVPISVEHVVLGPSTSLTSSTLLLPNLHFPNDNNNNNNNNNNTKTSSSDFDPQDSGANSTASSARVLNKIASKMGRLNLRYALVGCAAAANEGTRSGTVSSSTAGFDSRSPAATDSSTTSNDVEAATFEDYASLFQQSGANVSEQGMEDELFRLQSLYSSYSWSDFGDNIVLDDDLDQVFFPSLRNGDSE